MKKGIIIIFGRKDVSFLGASFLKSFINQKIKICLINNGGDELVFRLLFELKKVSKCDISILTLRREKKIMLAIKAGVRLLSTSTTKNIGFIMHAKPTSILNLSLIEKLLNLSEIELPDKKNERILLRKVYSINEIINC
ncbi:hypothetical protein PG913_06780 [Tenacibaculum pacificus]|uniref:hypothetical protein n=1 Tax=Tenacibaculum pacificus TaxID=3018314 RepID=UPI0022F3F226|nr:hypothetical protein [Tenacibaculum pacificus]WBX72623.1 hypothetical protein PG913_06780 [Tenacibaculum pacificus]